MDINSLFIGLLSTVTLTLYLATPAHAVSVVGQGTWESTLLGRDINRNAIAATDASAVYLYDTTLNVTWLRNANANGPMAWDAATTWAANLSTGSGVNALSDWRLPTMTVANPNATYSFNGSTDQGFNVLGSSSEMASLFINTLGNKSYLNTSVVVQSGAGLTNTGSFQNLQSGMYWSGTEYAPLALYYAWRFSTSDVYQDANYKPLPAFAMAVRTGDVVMVSVPEPESYAMMLVGLGLVGAIARRRTAKQIS